MLEIPSNLYGREIGIWLNTNEVGEDSIALADILKRISFYYLPDFENLKLSEQEIQILSSIDWSSSDNLFLKACCLEKLRHINKENKLKATRSSSDTYLDLFKHSLSSNKINYAYLRRAIYIRDIKCLNDDTFLTNISEYFEKLPIGWITDITDLLLRSYSFTQLEILLPYIQIKKQEATQENKFENERKCLDLLLKLHNIDCDSYNFLMALSYEKEINFIQSNTNAYTINMHLPTLAKNAYQYIFKIRKIKIDDFHRIEKLMQQLCKRHTEIISQIGIPISYFSHISDKDKKRIIKYLKLMKYDTVKDVFDTLQQVPFFEKDTVQNMMQQHHTTAPLSTMCGVRKINKEGRTIGTENAEEGLRTEVHRELRANMLFIIGNVYLQIRQSNVELSCERIFEYIIEHKPNFLSNDSVYLLSKGIAYGFADDFISAVHILTPTLECMLRNFTEYKCGSIAKWHQEDIQEDRTLGGILDIIKQNNLIDEEIQFELHCFLESKIDVNYRNNLLHGLMPVKQMVNDGIYLWWLCIKLLSILPNS